MNNINIGYRSDVGKKRSENQDNLGFSIESNKSLFIVCDGMGGHSGGKTASLIGVETIKMHFEKLSTPFDPKEELENALQNANRAILAAAEEDPLLRGMGTTIVVLLALDKTAYLAHVGDSRIYLSRHDGIKQMTKDHSLVQRMIDMNEITVEEARTHPEKNVILKALGVSNNLKPDITEPITLNDQDRFILCTDGLTEHVSDDEIHYYTQRFYPKEAVEKLINLANDRGGKDNITVIIVHTVFGVF